MARVRNTIAVVLNGKRFNLEFSQSNRNVGNLRGENMWVQCLRKSRQKMSETFILVRLMLSRKLQGIVVGMYVSSHLNLIVESCVKFAFALGLSTQVAQCWNQALRCKPIKFYMFNAFGSLLYWYTMSH